MASWAEFKTSFLTAFLAEDYEDELAERVRTKKQGEHEPVRDFAYSYRALCSRWNPALTEKDIVKLILKHIKPHLASHLRGRVEDVDELVRLGHQMEKDHELQLVYERNIHARRASLIQKGLHPPNLPQEDKNPLCWRCRGIHSPGSCPQYNSSTSTQMSSQYNRQKLAKSKFTLVTPL